MEFQLHALSPVDGRYQPTTQPLSAYFSEFAVIRQRVLVEIEYLIALCNDKIEPLKELKAADQAKLRKIYSGFSLQDALDIKNIEKTTNHDVKAIEYFLQDKFEKLGLKKFKAFIHFGLTSQDINNTVFPMLLQQAHREVMMPVLEEIIRELTIESKQWKQVPMLAHTHGQPASPTTVGKELFVFVERLKDQIKLLKGIPFSGKFGGATGNFNAHAAAYPQVKWTSFADQFLQKQLGIQRQQTTTQIEHYDHLAAYCDGMKRINTILLDLDRDMWSYISMEYFTQKANKKEVGSSTMPHKVNPIDFENSEGNLGIANTLFEHFSAKLPLSRLQRDLTDSTVIRNLGVALGHTLIAWKSLLKGLKKVELNKAKIEDDLDRNWAVISEAIQTILRREGYPEPYEALKSLTRGNKQIDRAALHQFIDDLKISKTVKTELKKITPFIYTGIISF
ncbi:MAG: adenylosuccinate lyase [Bacteroidetes bacterium]|nr:adenylosuccinate lyase [Bacteroidota bacterium]